MFLSGFVGRSCSRNLLTRMPGCRCTVELIFEARPAPATPHNAWREQPSSAPHSSFSACVGASGTQGSALSEGWPGEARRLHTGSAPKSRPWAAVRAEGRAGAREEQRRARPPRCRCRVPAASGAATAPGQGAPLRPRLSGSHHNNRACPEHLLALIHRGRAGAMSGSYQPNFWTVGVAPAEYCQFSPLIGLAVNSCLDPCAYQPQLLGTESPP